MKDKKKTWIAVIALLLLLIAAFYVNYRLNAAKDENEPTVAGEEDGNILINPEGSETVSAGTEYFMAVREQRDELRNQEFTILESMINDPNSDSESQANAQAQKLELVANMEKEFTIESILKAKGFKDSAVFFHAGSVNVIVDSETLTEEQVAQILDIVLRETGEKAENVKVSPKN
jgi:stage III sporulation protein AH